MMEMKFSVVLEVPAIGGRRRMTRAARELMLKLASELIRCSVASDDEDGNDAPAGTTKKRSGRFRRDARAAVG